MLKFPDIEFTNYKLHPYIKLDGVFYKVQLPTTVYYTLERGEEKAFLSAIFRDFYDDDFSCSFAILPDRVVQNLKRDYRCVTNFRLQC